LQGAGAERERIEADQARLRGRIERLPAPERIPNRGRLRIETHIPGEIDAPYRGERLDPAIDDEQVAKPAHHHVAERREPAAPDREIERGVKAIAAPPIGRRIVIV